MGEANHVAVFRPLLISFSSDQQDSAKETASTVMVMNMVDNLMQTTESLAADLQRMSRQLTPESRSPAPWCLDEVGKAALLALEVIHAPTPRGMLV